MLNKELKIKVDIHNYDFFSQTKLTETEKRQFILDHSQELDKKLTPEWRCQFFLKKLAKYYKLNIVTARKYNQAASTIEWLDKNDIPYDNIYFNTGDKLDVCNFLNTQYMIDDSPWVVRKLNKNNVYSLIYNRPYNHMVKESQYTRRVNNWQEIYQILV